MEPHYTDKELSDLVRKLNAFYSEGMGWDFKKSQKEHTDLFGDKIERGTYYYRLYWGYNDFSSDLKLSEKNMQQVCFLIFAPPSSEVEVFTDTVLEKRFENMRKVMSKIQLFNPRTDS
jgi:hypothetical protein